MSPFNKQQVKLTALVALFGLLFQAFVPLVQALPLANSDDGLTGHIVICSAFGIKTIDAATGIEIPDSEEDPDGQNGTRECVVCLASTIGDSALSNACEAVYSQLSGKLVALGFSNKDTFYFQLQYGAHGARAPPAA